MRETYISRTGNHMFALKSLTNTNKIVEGRHKNRVGGVSGHKQLFLRLSRRSDYSGLRVFVCKNSRYEELMEDLVIVVKDNSFWLRNTLYVHVHYTD